MRYRLEHLNQVQYAYDENRKAELEGKGFRCVNARGSAEMGTGPEEGMTEKPESAKKPAGKTKTEKGEKKDAG